MIQSVFSRLLLDIMNQVSSTMPEVRLVDRYLGQDQTPVRPAIASPAVLVDIDSETYHEIADGSQYVDPATISVRLLVDNYSASSAKAPQSARERAMNDFELEQQLVNCLHNWAPADGYCTSLIRTEATSENRHDIGLRIRTITFTTSWEEMNE